MPRVVVVSPPFRSHAQPLSVLARSLAKAGADVIFASTPEFADLAATVAFTPLRTSGNANTGVAEATAQDDGSTRRLAEFLDSTRRGAVPALLTQTSHRRADMLAAPEEVLGDLAVLHDRLRPDWYVVDQLNYPVTLALHTLGLPFASFCPGHPTYLVTRDDQFFGLPQLWPSAVRPAEGELAVLREATALTDTSFTALFADFVRRHGIGVRPPRRAFALTSSHAVVLNYPPFPWLPPLPEAPERVFLGHCTEPEALDDGWRERIRGRRVVLVALGTFLSARDDVLRVAVTGALRIPDVTVVVAAGARAAALADLADDPRVVLEPVVPQRALLPHVAAVVHHGGNNSFTEALVAGVPALVLPFSSDQFCVAHDVERSGAGSCLDPNALTPAGVEAALRALPGRGSVELRALRDGVRAAGPDHGASALLRTMERAHPNGR
ncbi:glycosyltransferase [Umezawaea sp. Da 62-37]|uniref:glycosyltransferase n=1 Tax=Umezawaea sp. Da 62-37 TaxID=3075927 RepID=UPI0028F70D91|nr:glycosyltransferase [Umezawaea sp. Da 62-37]WNV88343.1 glycosyltransferase [Umezawaea sp. Da 62-37]